MPVALKDNEKIHQIIKKHWIVFYYTTFFSILLLISLGFVLFYFNFDFWGYQWYVLGGIVGIMTIHILYKYYIWHNNALIITDQRLVSKDQFSLFSKKVRAVLYDDIVDISYLQKGVTAIMCNYGTLVVRVSSGSRVALDVIPNPWNVVEAINQIKLETRSKNPPRQQEEEDLHGKTIAI